MYKRQRTETRSRTRPCCARSGRRAWCLPRETCARKPNERDGPSSSGRELFSSEKSDDGDQKARHARALKLAVVHVVTRRSRAVCSNTNTSNQRKTQKRDVTHLTLRPVSHLRVFVSVARRIVPRSSFASFWRELPQHEERRHRREELTRDVVRDVRRGRFWVRLI